MKIITPCAYCRTPFPVGFWNYLPISTLPVDIYCPQCGGRNNINLGSIFLAVATLLLFALLGAQVAKTTQGTVAGAVVVMLVAMVLAAWPTAFVASRRPGLVKYLSWWNRPAPPISDADGELMDQLGVLHNGHYFIVGDMHFDHIGDALAYARERASGAP